EALKRAGDDLTGPGIKKALESFRDFDPMGLSSPVTYTSESHKPCSSLRIYQVKGGKLTPVTDLITLGDKE
ncbi:MAG: ABC transporter substrate-binding protein, partial [Thermodesulfobacteriota bacterium]|nr:ABC transporter substrate-binding protein [Thermodesulfobacteriota bacterium]